MTFRSLITSIAMITIALSWAHPADMNHSIHVYTEADINRTLPGQWFLSAQYELLLFKNIYFHCGLDFDILNTDLAADAFEFGYHDIMGWNLDFNIKFLHLIYSQYSKSVRSVIPYFEYEGKWFFADLGINFRFLNSDPGEMYNPFAYASDIREQLFYYAVGGKLPVIAERIYVRLEISNHDEFYAGNNGTIGYFIKSLYRVNDRLDLVLHLSAFPSGAIALSANAYRFGIRIGTEVEL